MITKQIKYKNIYKDKTPVLWLFQINFINQNYINI